MKGSFKIAGVTVTVREVEGNCRVDTNMGRSDAKMGEITICADMPDDMKEITLIHEYIHILLDLHGYEETNDEKLVNLLAISLYEQGFRIKLENKQ